MRLKTVGFFAPKTVHGKEFVGGVVVLVVMLVSSHVWADYWPQFRGLNVDGVAPCAYPEIWGRSTNVRWKRALSGEGWSCPIVWGNQVILTAAVRTDRAADATSSQPEPYHGGGGRRRTDLTQATYRWEVLCLDAETGQVRWQRTARTGKPALPRHSSNSYATETAVTDGQLIYAYFGMMGLYCFNMSGQLQWQQDLGVYEMRAGWGTASSPILFDGRLFLQIDNQQQSFLVALEAETGKELWRAGRDEPSQYSTPVIWRNGDRNELIAGGQICRSYDPNTGELLWQLDMEKGRSSATPLAVGDRLYVGTEFRNRGGPDDGGGFLFGLRPGGKGDISPTNTEPSSSAVAWQTAASGIQMASPVLCGGHLYLLERRSGTLHCINANTGEKVYRQRIPGARAFWASPWTANGKVFCLDGNGTTHVLAGGSEFRVLRRNVIDEQCWSSPAIARNSLFLRTAEHLYCFAEKTP